MLPFGWLTGGGRSVSWKQDNNSKKVPSRPSFLKAISKVKNPNDASFLRAPEDLEGLRCCELWSFILSCFWGPLELLRPLKRSKFWTLDIKVCLKNLGIKAGLYEKSILYLLSPFILKALNFLNQPSEKISLGQRSRLSKRAFLFSLFSLFFCGEASQKRNCQLENTCTQGNNVTLL